MTVEKSKLKNSVRILNIDLPDSLSTTILIMVKAGSRYESPKENGIAHFIEHIIFKGSEKYPDPKTVSYQIECLGGQTNAFTSEEYTGYYIKCANENFAKAFDILSDMFLNPLFDEKELTKEKGVVIEEIRMYEDQPEVKVGENFQSEMFNGDHLGQPITGPIENISDFSHEMVMNFRNRLYTGSNVVIAIAGKLDKVMVNEKIQIFESIPETGKSYFEVSNKKFSYPNDIIKKEVNQTHLVYGTYALKSEDPDREKLKVASMVLGGGMGSELTLKLREELGIAYYADAFENSFEDRGLMGVSAGVDSTKINQALDAIKAVIENLKSGPIPAESLLRAKELLKSYYTLDFESSDNVANFLGLRETVLGSYRLPSEIIDKINKVTVEDVHEMTKRIWEQDTHLSVITNSDLEI